MDATCSHLDQIHDVEPSGPGCVECLASGGWWMHLRRCTTCGHIGCCDSSPSRNATKHAAETGHPIVQSYEPGEEWAWCYVDEAMLDEIPAFPGESPTEHYGPLI